MNESRQSILMLKGILDGKSQFCEITYQFRYISCKVDYMGKEISQKAWAFPSRPKALGHGEVPRGHGPSAHFVLLHTRGI